MKNVWNSIFQTVSQSVKIMSENMSKKVRHDVVLMTTGISVVTLLTFLAGDLSGNGQSTLMAYAETPVQTAAAETELENADLNDLMIGEEHNDNQRQERSVENWSSILSNEKQTEKNLVAEMMPKEDEMSVNEMSETETKTEDENADEKAEAEAEAKIEVESETEIEETEEEDEETEEETEEESELTLSPEEYNVLLRIVQAEAGTCDETGKLLVANVILNRMEDEEFPDTVSGVVYQKRQFSPVMNGSINTCKVTMETRSAVNRALQGEDPSEGALYFMNRSKSSSRNVRWFDANLDYLFKHGDHEFFK